MDRYEQARVIVDDCKAFLEDGYNMIYEAGKLSISSFGCGADRDVIVDIQRGDMHMPVFEVALHDGDITEVVRFRPGKWVGELAALAAMRRAGDDEFEPIDDKEMWEG